MILTFVFLSVLPAETVLLCMSDVSPELERADWPLLVMRAVEDGIMDEFFEAGHIVTNTFFNEAADDSDPSMPPGNIPMTIADRIYDLGKTYGADIVLYLTVFFPESPDDNLPMPEKIEYTVYQIGRQSGIFMDFRLDVLDGKTESTGLDLCTEAGRMLADQVFTDVEVF